MEVCKLIVHIGIGVSLGTVFTETYLINPKKNDFGIIYWNNKNRNTEKIWFAFGITPIKIEIPLYRTENNEKYNMQKMLTHNTLKH